MAAFLITGANGKQGSATARSLLAAGAKVHALVRDPTSEAARQLENQGARVFKYRDFDDAAAIRDAAEGCRGVFLALWPAPEAGAQARRIVEACRDGAGGAMEFVVLSTAFWTADRAKWLDEKPLVEYYEVKTEMEQAVRSSGLRYTILRPSWIHYNYTLPLAAVAFPELVARAELAYPHDLGAVRMPHIDEADVGRFAAAALLDPGRFHGEEIELGSENLTAREARDAVARATGRGDVAVRRRTAPEVEEGAARGKNPLQMFQLWASRVDVTIDGEALQRKYGIRLTPFEEYVRREKDRFLATLPAEKK